MILVHIDAGDTDTDSMLRRVFSDLPVRWFSSVSTKGPGGGRNRLVEEANHAYLVSLDDDSWPIDCDFFARAGALLDAHPRAGLFATNVAARGQPYPVIEGALVQVAGYENCGCVFRRAAFLSTAGYVPLRHAYGMEETDLALQLLDNGWEIHFAPELRIFHDTELSHHASRTINAAQIANTALLTFLRYPAAFWALGVAQVLNRVLYSVRMGRFEGILQGLLKIPALCWAHRERRKVVRRETIRLSRSLKRGVRP